MKLGFHGAAGEVTGSCYLLETERARVLVDFGLYQGGPISEVRNRHLPPVDFPSLDAVVLTHAHIDHSGRLPLLPRVEYRRPVYSTPATADLCGIMLRDAAHLQEHDAERYSRKRLRKGKSAVAPLYTQADVEALLPSFVGVPYGEEREVAPGVGARFHDAGHILGSAIVELVVEDRRRRKTLVFSGDLGNPETPILRDPAVLHEADVLVLESTYGDRNHRPLPETIEELATIVQRAHHPDGKVLIPAFAVGRSQDLIYHLGGLQREGRLEAAVYVDSPMAIATTELYRRHRESFDEEARGLIDRGLMPLDFPSLRFSRTPEESRALNSLGDGTVVISASGMCTGGRILHHLKHNVWRPEVDVVIVGFQARGTPGRALVDGAGQITVMGERLAVRARVHTLGGFSAHAGQTQLIEWARHFRARKPRFFLTHGEPAARDALRAALHERLRLEAECPRRGQTVQLG
jgi:metallo-beta-lactamase family protein